MARKEKKRRSESTAYPMSDGVKMEKTQCDRKGRGKDGMSKGMHSYLRKKKDRNKYRK